MSAKKIGYLDICEIALGCYKQDLENAKREPVLYAFKIKETRRLLKNCAATIRRLKANAKRK